MISPPGRVWPLTGGRSGPQPRRGGLHGARARGGRAAQGQRGRRRPGKAGTDKRRPIDSLINITYINISLITF